MKSWEWEEKYRAGDIHWNHGAPSPGLVEFLHAHPELPKGSVAVPGCGTGHDLLAWARAGFNALGYDLAPSAVQLASRRILDSRLSAGVVELDFLKDEPPQRFDFLWEHTLFCAIQPTQRESYAEAAMRWLRPGGTYLAVNYIVCGPEGPPWPVTPRELWQRFTPGFELIDQWVPRSYQNRCGKELMLWWRRKRG